MSLVPVGVDPQSSLPKSIAAGVTVMFVSIRCPLSVRVGACPAVRNVELGRQRLHERIARGAGRERECWVDRGDRRATRRLVGSPLKSAVRPENDWIVTAALPLFVIATGVLGPPIERLHIAEGDRRRADREEQAVPLDRRVDLRDRAANADDDVDAVVGGRVAHSDQIDDFAAIRGDVALHRRRPVAVAVEREAVARRDRDLVRERSGPRIHDRDRRVLRLAAVHVRHVDQGGRDRHTAVERDHTGADDRAAVGERSARSRAEASDRSSRRWWCDRAPRWTRTPRARQRGRYDRETKTDRHMSSVANTRAGKSPAESGPRVDRSHLVGVVNLHRLDDLLRPSRGRLRSSRGGR